MDPRLLFLAQAYPPPLEGGSVVYLYNLITNLPHERTLVVTDAREEQGAFDCYQAYPVIRTAHLYKDDVTKQERISEFLHLTRAARRVVDPGEVSLVHAGEVLPSGLVAWWLKKRVGLPYVVYLYAEELSGLHSRKDLLWATVLKKIYRLVVREAAGCVVVSDYTRDLLTIYRYRTPRVLKVVPMVGEARMPDEIEKSALLNRLGHTGDESYILAVGRLIERKGFDNLLRAFGLLQCSHPNARLLIVGRGPQEQMLKESAIELGVGDKVHFAGFVADEELPAYYEVSDVFAMPHRELPDGDTEGCPTVFLEAGAHGKPCVGGSAGGVRDAIIDGETGMIVDGSIPSHIAHALDRLLTDRELARRLGENGRKRVRTELSPATGAKKVLQFSRDILGLQEAD